MNVCYVRAYIFIGVEMEISGIVCQWLLSVLLCRQSSGLAEADGSIYLIHTSKLSAILLDVLPLSPSVPGSLIVSVMYVCMNVWYQCWFSCKLNQKLYVVCMYVYMYVCYLCGLSLFEIKFGTVYMYVCVYVYTYACIFMSNIYVIYLNICCLSSR